MIDTLFAASIHEIKNRFGLMLNELEQLLASVSANTEQQQSITHIRHDAQFIGAELVRMLSMVKSASGQLKAVVDQQFIEDFLEDIVARHHTTAHATGVSIGFECDEDLAAFFDASLVTIVMDTCIYNAIKAGARRVTLRADASEASFQLFIDDDGPGFPESMKEAFGRGEVVGRINVAENSTGMGLFFARQLLDCHQEADRHGSLALDQSPEGGARVILSLPQ